MPSIVCEGAIYEQQIEDTEDEAWVENPVECPIPLRAASLETTQCNKGIYVKQGWGNAKKKEFQSF